MIDSALENLRLFKDKDGRRFALAIGVNSPIMHVSSNLASAVYASDDSIDYVAVWHPGGGREGTTSLYSRKGGFDVSVVARAQGGGGHAGAAGYKPDIDLNKLVARALFGNRKGKT